MTIFCKKISFLFLMAGSFVACDTYDPEFNETTLPERITFTAPRQYPEGIAYAPSLDKFVISSITQGKVGFVDQNGRYEDFIQRDTSLISAIGLKVYNGKLYVCNGDQGVSTKSKASTTLKTAGLFVYDLATGNNLARYDLAALYPDSNHFANDVAFDDKGNAYVTDSFAPVIYVVPADTTKPRVFVQSPLFAGATGFNLNGIVYHSDNFLIVAKSNDGTLFKVNLNNPSLINQIVGPALPSADGMVLHENDLYVVNSRNRVTRVRSDDNWSTFKIVETDSNGYDQATTNVVVDGRIFTLNARIGEVGAAVSANNPNQLQASEYSIQQFRSGVLQNNQ